MMRMLGVLCVLLTLGCAAEPDPLPTELALAPDVNQFTLVGQGFTATEAWTDSSTQVRIKFFTDSSRFPGSGMRSLYLNWYFANKWGPGVISRDDVTQTFLASHGERLEPIPAPANDTAGRYFTFPMESTGPRTHFAALVRIGVAGDDAFSLTFVQKFWSDSTERDDIVRAWVRDSAGYWASQIGRLRLEGPWREYFGTSP